MRLELSMRQGASVAPAHISLEVAELLCRTVDMLRTTDQAPLAVIDERNVQMFTWNENMSLLLCSAIQGSAKNPFKAILHNFNRAVEAARADPAYLAAVSKHRPLRDRSSLRKRLQKMLHGEQLSKDWEATRRAAANLFVNSARKRLDAEGAAGGAGGAGSLSVSFLRKPSQLIELAFPDMNPTIPAIMN